VGAVQMAILSPQATFWLFAVLGVIGALWSLRRAVVAFRNQQVGAGIWWIIFTPVAFVLGFFIVVILVGAAALAFFALIFGPGDALRSPSAAKGDVYDSRGRKVGEGRERKYL
jgi:hypothetical protein